MIMPKPTIADDQTPINLCGIVMPIEGFLDYQATHWLEVRAIIDRAISVAGFQPTPVWEHAETDIIQGRIIRNLYEHTIVVCDISGLNPNVMFELGLRLAFKKPVVIIVDDETKIPFDTNVIEHIFYPKSLNFTKIENFIRTLSTRISTVYDKFAAGNFTAYIDAFGAFSTFEPVSQKVEFDQYVLDKLDQISASVSRLQPYGGVHPLLGTSVSAKSLTASDILNSIDETTPSIWNEEKISTLRSLWEAGETASAIAEALGNVSRNAVIGKAHRLGLKAKPSSVKDN